MTTRLPGWVRPPAWPMTTEVHTARLVLPVTVLQVGSPMTSTW